MYPLIHEWKSSVKKKIRQLWTFIQQSFATGVNMTGWWSGWRCPVTLRHCIGIKYIKIGHLSWITGKHRRFGGRLSLNRKGGSGNRATSGLQHHRWNHRSRWLGAARGQPVWDLPRLQSLLAAPVSGAPSTGTCSKYLCLKMNMGYNPKWQVYSGNSWLINTCMGLYVHPSFRQTNFQMFIVDPLYHIIFCGNQT